MSESLGIDLKSGILFLYRGRDFKWQYDNEDKTTREIRDFPAGDMFLELDTGGQQNALQEVTIDQTSGGAYKFSLDLHSTEAIAYDAITVSPEGATESVQHALEELPNVGVGNVEVHPAQLFPVWEIDLTLNAGNNELQQLVFSNTTGGTFKLGYGLQYTDLIAYGAAPSVVQIALEGLPGIGAGNISVTPVSAGYQFEFLGALADTDVNQIIVSAIGIDLSLGIGHYVYGLTNSNGGVFAGNGLGSLFPIARVSTVRKGTAKWSDTLVNTLNTVINNFFNSFDSILGVDIEYKVVDNLNTTLTVTSLVAFTEATLLTFSVDITSELIEGFLNSVAQFIGIFETIHVDFYWKRVYQVEFVGDLAQTQQNALVPNITSLTGLNGDQHIDVEVIQPGKARFTIWDFDIDGSTASIKVDSDECDVVLNRTNWQLVFLPAGETAGGDPVGIGRVRTRGDDRLP